MRGGNRHPQSRQHETPKSRHEHESELRRRVSARESSEPSARMCRTCLASTPLPIPRPKKPGAASGMRSKGPGRDAHARLATSDAPARPGRTMIRNYIEEALHRASSLVDGNVYCATVAGFPVSLPQPPHSRPVAINWQRLWRNGYSSACRVASPSLVSVRPVSKSGE